MIIYPVHNFNKISQKLYDSSVKKLNIDSFKCPSCGKHHTFVFYGSYKRSCYASDGRLILLRIQRLLCTGCGRTHALLPCSIVPFRRYLLAHHYAFFHTGCSALIALFPWMDESTVRRYIAEVKNWMIRHPFSISSEPSVQDVSICFQRFASCIFCFHRICSLNLTIPT